MRKFQWFTALAGLVTLALASCGGSGCDTSFGGSCGTGTGGAKGVASIILVSDRATMPSDNSLPANLTAFVRDANNNFLANVPVVFTADSGGITVSQAVTDTNGVAKASVSTLADPTNRRITVTAVADTKSTTALVDVSGTKLTIQGPTALTSGQQGSYEVVLNDAGGHGISGAAVTVQLPAFLTGTTTGLVTDSQGRATFLATGGTGGGPSPVTATALGESGSIDVAVNGNSITFTAPTPAVGSTVPTINLKTPTTFTIHYVINGVAQNGATVSLATTRGCFSAGTTCTGQPTTATVTTNGTGDASVQVVSDNAGGANVSASAGTAVGQITVQFISTVAASIEVQPSIFTLAPNTPPKTDQQSTISAIVRDINNNLVTGATVTFTLNDVTGGTLTVGSALSDLQGRAQTVYVAGTTTSAANGVHVTATVQGTTVTPKTVDLTVARRQVFISIGTGNLIHFNTDHSQYEAPYIVQVTDSSGAGVAGVQLSMSVLSEFYFKGYRVKGAQVWENCYTYPIDQCTSTTPKGAGSQLLPLNTTWGCADEDVNRNGILDVDLTATPPYSEDNNHNNLLDAGNIALVSPNSVTTNASGFINVSVFYPAEYAYWLQVTLQAQASVQGTAFSAQSTFYLPGLKDDFVIAAAPPGPVSPFGRGNACNDTL